MKKIDVLRLWNNYLAALRNEIVIGGRWERGQADQSAYDDAAAKLYYNTQELENVILNGPVEALAQILWGVGTAAWQNSGGRLSRKYLKPDEPFLILTDCFRALWEIHGPEVGLRIWGIVLKMRDMHVDSRAAAIADAVMHFLKMIRIPGDRKR